MVGEEGEGRGGGFNEGMGREREDIMEYPIHLNKADAPSATILLLVKLTYP